MCGQDAAESAPAMGHDQVHDKCDGNGLPQMDQFPTQYLIPKECTGQPEFLKRHPQFDGRGTVIAILDTGVDLACPGLQVTSTGTPKIIDAVNFTGSGDVCTTVKRRVDPTTGILMGLSGRELRIPKEWTNPSGDFRLGLKPLFELYPDQLVTRTKQCRKENLIKELHPKVSEALNALRGHIDEHGPSTDKAVEKMTRKDLAYQLDYLKDFASKKDYGPVLDCLVWHDGRKWRACLDTSFVGDLDRCAVLTDFRDERQWAFISDHDRLAYCLAIRNEGDLLEIYTPSGAHGTHVAHIAAACYPDAPKRNGFAPGAQIVSILIGDHRNNTRTLGQAFSRALNYCAQHRVPLANFSYGGPHDQVPAEGALLRYLRRALEEAGLALFASAGNEGPALGSLSDPAALHAGVLGVAACMPQGAGPLLHGTLRPNPAHVMHFSSRGPSSDGALGISVSAPGAAIAGLPAYAMRAAEYRNGTSMACPSAVGIAACLISAAQAENLSVSPLKLKLALENAATWPENAGTLTKLDLGHGIINLPAAFQTLQQLTHVPDELSAFKVTVGHVSQCSNGMEQRGVFVREPYQWRQATDYTVWVEPMFRKDCPHPVRQAFQRRVRLQPSHPFLLHPAHLHLSSGHTSFQLRVQAEHVPEGQVVHAEVLGLDMDASARAGPVFRVPVTLVRPRPLGQDRVWRGSVPLKSATPCRLLLECPPKATDVEIRLANRRCHSVLPVYMGVAQKTAAGDGYEKYELQPGAQAKTTKWVRDQNCLEVSFVLDWTSFEAEADIEVEFEFSGYYGIGTGLPTLYFDWVQQDVKAQMYDIKVLNERADSMDGTDMYGLYLEFKITVNSSTTHKFSLPGVTDSYYGGVVDCVYMQLFDSQQYIRPQEFREYRNLSLGDHMLLVQLRSTDLAALERLTNIALQVQTKLDQLDVNVYGRLENAINRQSPLTTLALRDGQHRTLHLNTTQIAENLPKWCVRGDQLLGRLSLREGDPGQTVHMAVSELNGHNMNKSNRKMTLKKTITSRKTERINESLRDAFATQIRGAKDEKTVSSLITAFNAVANLSDESTKFLIPIKIAKLKRLFGQNTRDVGEIRNVAYDALSSFKLSDLVLFNNNKGKANNLGENDLSKSVDQFVEIHNILLNTLLDDFLVNTTRNVPEVFRNQFSFKLDDGFLTSRSLQQHEGSFVDMRLQHDGCYVPKAKCVELDSTQDSCSTSSSDGDMTNSVSSVSGTESSVISRTNSMSRDSGVELSELAPLGPGEEVERTAGSDEDGLEMVNFNDSVKTLIAEGQLTEATDDAARSSTGDQHSTGQSTSTRSPTTQSTSQTGRSTSPTTSQHDSTATSGQASNNVETGDPSPSTNSNNITDQSTKTEASTSVSTLVSSVQQVAPRSGKSSPTVASTTDDEKLAEIDGLLDNYVKVVRPKTTAYRVMKVKYAVCHGLYGLGVKRLVKLLNGRNSRLTWQALYQLSDELDWSVVAERWRNLYLHQYCIPHKPF